MKIRCKNCYRILNPQEEYCTRCGTKSLEIVALMKTGKTTISETKKLSVQLSLYFAMVFLINGILNVLFGVLFDRFHPGLYYGDFDERLPESITLFASTNALLITGIALLVIFLFINYRHLKDFFFKIKLKRFIISFLFGSLIITIILLLYKKTNIIIIPSFFQSFLKNGALNSIYQPKLLSIWLILVSYAIIHEMLFRFQLINAFDEATLLPDWLITILVVITSVFFEIISFSFDWSLALFSIAFHLILSTSYFFNQRLLSFNLYFRLILITLLFII